MKYCKNLDGEYISCLSTGFGEVEISEEEYNGILSIIRAAPTAPEGYIYLLRADTLEWELVELPPEPEPEDPELDNAEAFDIIFGEVEQ